MTDAPDIKELAAPGLHRRVLEVLRDLPIRSVLDLGAGEGAFARTLRSAGYDVTACDVDPSIFRSPEIPFRQGDFNAGIPFDDGAFDAVVFIEVLEHLTHPWKALAEIRRVLRPGGWLILTTPNVTNIRQRLHFLLRGRFYGFGHPIIRSPLEHIHPFSLSELAMMMNENGFEHSFRFDRPFRFKAYLPTVALTGLTTIVRARKKG
jgi:SAM-dependent methyltransferase